MRRTTSVVACLATLAALQALAGCGQKGPLTLPAQPPASAASGAAR